MSAQVFYAKNIAGSCTPTVTVHAVDNGTYFGSGFAAEYSGLSTTTPFDKEASALSNSDSTTSNTATTTAANEVLYVCAVHANITDNAGTGYTRRLGNNNVSIEDKIVSATGAYNATLCENASCSPAGTNVCWNGGCAIHLATFK